MADDLIHCPSCGFQLRLPTELYGTTVECPQCHTRFTAPVPAAQPPAVRPPPGREYDANAPTISDAYGHDVPPAGAGLTAPAVCLLVTSLIGVIFSGYTAIAFVQVKNQPAEYDKAVQDAIAKNPKMTAEEQEVFKQWAKLALDYGPPTCGTLFGLNLVTAFGAMQMLRRRMYGLAIFASVLALNPANVACCFLCQTPFGLWALIVLLSGNGRRAFH
jgi:hypothetical protein